jgi:hypothetical protein
VDADIRLPDPAVSRAAGTVNAVEDHWVTTNLSRRSTYVIENPEGGGEFVKLAPRRVDMPVPFELARVVVPAEDRATAPAANAHTVNPAAPQSFILLDEQSAGLLTVRTWYTSNGGVHGEGSEAGSSFPEAPDRLSPTNQGREERACGLRMC